MGSMSFFRPWCHINWKKIFSDWVRYDHDDELQYIDDVTVKDVIYVYKCKRCDSYDIIPENFIALKDRRRREEYLLSKKKILHVEVDKGGV